MQYATVPNMYSDILSQKINARNAFGLHLIDYMLEVLRKRGEMTNFQVSHVCLQVLCIVFVACTDYPHFPACSFCHQIAGCTLDAGAKIYAGRVDSIYNDAYKMLGGLGRGETQGACYVPTVLS